MADRNTQTVVEVALAGTTAVRATQIAMEVLMYSPPPVRKKQRRGMVNG